MARAAWILGIVLVTVGLAPARAADPPSARVAQFSPQGTVKGVRQVTVRFSEPMVPLGDGPLATRYWTAAKTGTSRDMRDNWCVGYSRRYTVGVWVGNFEGDPMRDVSGISGAAPIWREVMDWLHRGTPSAAPPAPPGVVTARIGAGGAEERFLAGTEPPAAVARPVALSSAGHRPPPADPTAPSLVHVTSRPADNAPAVVALARIAAPAPRTIIAVDPDIPADRQRVIFEAAGATGELRWQIGADDLGPAGRIVAWRPRPGRHTLALVDNDRRVVDSITFEVRGAAAR